MDSMQSAVNLEGESPLFSACVDQGLNPMLGVATLLVANGRCDGPAKTFSGENLWRGSPSLSRMGGRTEGPLLKNYTCGQGGVHEIVHGKHC